MHSAPHALTLRALLSGATLALAVGCSQLSSTPAPTQNTARPLLRTLSAERPVDASKSLMITDLSVVEDAVRTTYVPGVSASSDPRGAWSFGRLMENMADGRNVSDFTLNWLRQWEREQRINGFVSTARPLMRTTLIDPWLVASGCAAGVNTCRLDFSKAPFRLLAIASRLDLREINAEDDDDLEVDHAGEGRFIFGATRQDGSPLVFTVIFEYELLADELEDVIGWADRWHRLGAMPFGPDYNAALQQITQGYAGRGVASSKRNRNAINQIRTNEASLGAPGSDPDNLPSTRLWDMREFVLNSVGQLVQTTVKQNPDLSFNNTALLANYINQNEQALLSGKFTVPAASLGAAALTPKTLVWTAPGIRNEAARGQFALATCSGCHLSETNTNFLHIGRRAAGVSAPVSAWLASELGNRASDLGTLLSKAEVGDDLPDGDDDGKAH